MLEQTDAITNDVLEPVTFVLAYPIAFVNTKSLFYLTHIVGHLLSNHLSHKGKPTKRPAHLRVMKERFSWLKSKTV